MVTGEKELSPIKDYFRSPLIYGWDNNKIMMKHKLQFNFYNNSNFFFFFLYCDFIYIELFTRNI